MSANYLFYIRQLYDSLQCVIQRIVISYCFANYYVCSLYIGHDNVTPHYNDVIMGTLVPQITSLPIVCSTV